MTEEAVGVLDQSRGDRADDLGSPRDGKPTVRVALLVLPCVNLLGPYSGKEQEQVRSTKENEMG